MQRYWKVVGVAAIVAIVGILAVGAVALAQEPEDGADWPFNLRERMHEVVSGILGVSPETYEGALDSAREQVLDEAVAEGLLTEEQAERMQERVEQGFGPGMMGGAFGSRGGRQGAWGGRGGFVGGPENSLMAVAAEKLGMTTQELWEQLQDGGSIADVATEKGVDPQAIADEYIAGRTELVNEAVAEGRITQERADWMLEHMGEEVMEHLTEPFSMGGQGQGGCPRGLQDGFQGGSRMRPGGRLPAVTGENDA